MVPAHPVRADRLRPGGLRPRDAPEPPLGADRAADARPGRAALGGAARDLAGDRRRARARTSRAAAGARRRRAARRRAAPSSATLDPAEAARRCRAPGFVLAVGTLEPRKNLPRLVDRLPQAARGSCSARIRSWSSARSAGRPGETLDALRSLGERCTTARLRLRCGARGALPPLRGVLLPLARRGLRAAGAGGDGRRRGGAHLERLLAAGGRRRRGRVRRPVRRREHRGGLERLLDSPARARGWAHAARERAAMFSWERTAEIVLGVLEEAAR